MKINKTKECMAYYFEKHDIDFWKCNICKRDIKQKDKTGYSNLQSHITTHVPDYVTAYNKAKAEGSVGGSLDSFGFINQRTKDLHDWMKWIVDRNLPLHEIEENSTRKVVTMQSFSVETLTKYMRKVTEAVETKMTNDLPETFAIVFDGWTRHSRHYLAVFAVYMKKDQKETILLAIAPPYDEESYNADEHITFIRETLNIYGKSLSNVCVFVGDNCATNMSMSRKTGIALIGCYSHKFNLAVNHHLENSTEKEAIDNVHELMVELRTLKNAARLRKLNVSAAKKNNDTRWSSTYDMIKRYLEINEVVETIDTQSIIDKLLSRTDHRKIEHLMLKLKLMQDVSKELQRESLTLDEARDLFDGVVDEFPDMERHLNAEATIVVDPELESGIIKVLRNKQSTLDVYEMARLEKLKKPTIPANDEDNDDIDEVSNFAQRLLKRRRLAAVSHDYLDLTFIPPTSNIVERLFSTAKLILSDQRAAILPFTFEMLLFLKVNSNWWNLQTVDKAMQS